MRIQEKYIVTVALKYLMSDIYLNYFPLECPHMKIIFSLASRTEFIINNVKNAAFYMNYAIS